MPEQTGLIQLPPHLEAKNILAVVTNGLRIANYEFIENREANTLKVQLSDGSVTISIKVQS